MFRNGHQLEVCEAHLLAILDQLMCDFAVIHPAMNPFVALSPRTQVDFVGRYRLFELVLVLAPFEPR